MEVGDLIALRQEFIPDGKRRRPMIFLGMTKRFFAGVAVEEYHVMDLNGKKSVAQYKIIEKCEVISKLNDTKT